MTNTTTIPIKEAIRILEEKRNYRFLHVTSSAVERWSYKQRENGAPRERVYHFETASGTTLRLKTADLRSFAKRTADTL